MRSSLQYIWFSKAIMNNLKITAGKMFSKEIVMKIIFFFNILCAPNQNDIENCDKNKQQLSIFLYYQQLIQALTGCEKAHAIILARACKYSNMVSIS